MPFRSGKSHVHDKGRSMTRETSRSHFISEQKESEHELNHNRELIEKLHNDGYQFESADRSGDRYCVNFRCPKTQNIKTLDFLFEANYVKLESLWKPKS